MQKVNMLKIKWRFLSLAFFVALSSTIAGLLQPQNSSAISMDTRPTLVGREIHMGPNGGHIIMQGVNVWGIQTITMDGGWGDTQYADRVNIVNTVKSWGANHVRFRLQASDYNAETYMTKAEYLNRIQQWHDLIVGAGMYFMPVWWDAHDGPYSGAAWGDSTTPATNYTQAFPMMTDVMNLFPNDPMVLYEPFNEPTGAVNDVQWVAAMKDTISHFRGNGYTGILLIDPRVWAHCFDDADFTELEQHDAAQAGMNGTHQIIFTKHDYAREYTDPDAGFNQAEWLTNDGGCEDWDMSTHAVWESEFGNYSIDPSSVHPNWSAGAATTLHSYVCDGTIAGASPFLFGPWLDANAMTAADNTTPTTWGTQVDDLFLTSCPGDPLNGIGTLGSLIFFDNNKNGVYEPADGDHGFENVTVAIHANSTTGCDTPTGAPLITTTTDANGNYLYTLLPTDDGISANGPGAKYTVVVTDTNDVLGQYANTVNGTPNTNDNSQVQPFCTELTAAASDVQYADFGYEVPPTPTPNPDTTDGSGSSKGTAGTLAETGAPLTLPLIFATALMGTGFATWRHRSRR
ncbi:cellulase family glycosylhydrolase [Streptomyces caniscabiei]|uniref:cellulase family glycosylhydrolase n=1 Tax=Streptomyces caniscabiei TaxID=2746961 RepID=UPI0029AD8A16|nr:cellulase family glycosylhydrolase [Streptomyces caniscabiei]MDX2776132.1 cellulase family glycosylhydrolase [Streptomyces caniscabiei]